MKKCESCIYKHECVDADFDMWMINFLFNFTLIL